MRRTGVVVAVVLTASLGWSTMAFAGGGGSKAACPSGTTKTDGLCVAKSSDAQQSAEIVQSEFKDLSLASVIVSVWKGDDALVNGAIGESQTGVPATVDMRHITGNIANAMLSTVLLQQVEKGKLSLDDKLSKYFSDLPAADQITLEMLENSTSGYAHYPALDSFEAALYADPFKHWTPDEIIAYGVAGGPAFTPGSQFLFADTNFIIIAHVLEKATGTTVAELARTGIWEPLGMKNTFSPDSPELPDPVLHARTAERVVWEDSTFWDPTWTWWAGGTRSNQPDLQKFLVALGEGTLLSEESHEKQLARPENSGTPDAYFGLGVPMVNGWLFTNPGLEGYSGALAYLPSKKLGVIVYTTHTQQTDTSEAPASAILAAITKVLTPDKPVVPPS